MNKKFLTKIKQTSSIKPYSGKTTEIEKSMVQPILRSSPELNIELSKTTAVTKISKNDLICKGCNIQPLYPICACNNNKKWEIKIHSSEVKAAGKIQIGSATDGLDMLEVPEYFREKNKGVFAIKDGNESSCLTNMRLRVIAVIKRYWADEEKTTYEIKCQLYYDGWDTPQFIVVPINEYKQVYLFIKKKFPELYLSAGGKDALEKYLSEVYSQCKKSWEEELQIMQTGWTELNGNLCFAIGKDDAYKEYDFPDVASIINRTQIVEQGISFLEIGNFEAAAIVPFVFAHFAYTKFFVKKANHDFESVLFVCGASGSYKTSFMLNLCAVFETRTEKKMLSFGTTKPALYTALSTFRDQTVLLDDYSCSEQQKKQADNVLFEAAIRAIGDSTPPSKMSNSKNGVVADRQFRSTLVVTGEDNPALSASSQYRMITVSVDATSFDGKILRRFQEKPQIMRNYFALFIEFLRIHGEQIIDFVRGKLGDYREKYTLLIKKDRVRDATINLLMMAEIIRKYLDWCGVTNPELLKHMADVDCVIVNEMLKNQEEKDSLEPELMFVYALMQVLGTRDKAGLADSEDVYTHNESGYIGFREEATDTLWFRYEDAEHLVQNYWVKQGKTYLITSPKLRKLLYEKGISVGMEPPSGKTEYLKKSKKGQRKRMLVLRQEKIQEILDGVIK